MSPDTTDPAWSLVAAARLGEPAQPVPVAEETPVGVLYGGVPHAVMMATPADLEDFVVGFSVTESIAGAADIRGIETRTTEEGVTLDVALVPDRFRAFLARRRVRSLRGHTSCGLCGVEDIADTRADTPRAPPGQGFTRAAIERALAELGGHQALSRRTRAAHAAAWATPDGAIVLAREDIGRHNALDKLIGAGLRGGLDLTRGFCLVTSRCSYEMVQKALLAGMPALVAISAPTALAIRTAEAADLTLVALARPDAQTCYAAPHRIVAAG